MRTVHEKNKPFNCSKCDSTIAVKSERDEHICLVHEENELLQPSTNMTEENICDKIATKLIDGDNDISDANDTSSDIGDDNEDVIAYDNNDVIADDTHDVIADDTANDITNDIEIEVDDDDIPDFNDTFNDIADDNEDVIANANDINDVIEIEDNDDDMPDFDDLPTENPENIEQNDFFRKVNLDNTVFVSTPKNTKNLNKEPLDIKETQNCSEKQKYKCRLCEFEFDRKEDATQHILSIHFNGQQSDMEFSDQEYIQFLDLHIQLVHEEKISDAIKPKMSYAKLIAEALNNSSNGMLTVSDIYKAICVKHPYFKMETRGWKNCIRHNLSINKSFTKSQKKVKDGPYGFYWKQINIQSSHKKQEPKRNNGF